MANILEIDCKVAGSRSCFPEMVELASSSADTGPRRKQWSNPCNTGEMFTRVSCCRKGANGEISAKVWIWIFSTISPINP
jgi:hypothetical protein